MYSHSYKDGLMPRDHFEIWFRHHLRKHRYGISSYAERVGETVAHITAVFNGHEPNSSILKDLMMHRVPIDKDLFYRSDSYNVKNEQAGIDGL